MNGFFRAKPLKESFSMAHYGRKKLGFYSLGLSNTVKINLCAMGNTACSWNLSGQKCLRIGITFEYEIQGNRLPRFVALQGFGVSDPIKIVLLSKQNKKY